MIMKISRMRLQNFKGARDVTIDFGDVTKIKGANGVGKSTIPDAFNWVLFNSNANGDAPGSDNFRVKPLDSNGAEIHNLDTCVELYCMLNDQPFNLKRLQREKWVKTRGSIESTFQGNDSTYWINDVETGSNEFKSRISGIASGEVFRLITTLGAFNAMDWKKRRSVLLSICGTDVDAELLNSPKYTQIAEEIRNRGVNIDDFRKVLTDQKKRVHQELTLIPARIDEAKRLRPDVTDRQHNDALYDLADAQNSLTTVEAMIAKADAEDTNKATWRRIVEIGLAITSKQKQIDADWFHEIRQLRAAIGAESLNLTAAERSLKTIEAQSRANDDHIISLNNQIAETREGYKTEYSRAFVAPESPDTCPTCGQAIPAEQRAEAIAKAQAAFMEAKKKRLAEITENGRNMRTRLEAVTAEAAEIAKEYAAATATAAEARDAFSKATEAEKNHPAKPNYDTPELAEMESELESLKQSVGDEGAPNAQKAQLVERKAELASRIDRAKAVIAKHESAKTFDARIKELESQQTEYGTKEAAIEVQIYQAEQFITERCGCLEDGINSKFPTVRWKLFDRQINGAIVDCCECMIPADKALVSYSGTNTAARVNADIEIIGVLATQYDVITPVFVDNSERVNYIAKPAGQLITLSVSTDPELVIEAE